DSGKDVVGNVIQGGASILGNLFNTEDESDLNVAGVNLSGVESVWDGFLKGVGWGYDTINQAGSWANSAAPGGIDTFEWDQAGDISWGQSAIAANSALINDLGPAGAV
ncbi:hypothetical protein JZU56_04410, partial [bacterium]|nr:hypothetical protein [bacterium]